jgi:hypothetical protein
MSFVGPIRSEDLNDLVRTLLGAAGADSSDARLVAKHGSSDLSIQGFSRPLLRAQRHERTAFQLARE